MCQYKYLIMISNCFSENLPVTLAGKIPRPKHSPSSEYDFIDSRSLSESRYTDLGKNLFACVVAGTLTLIRSCI